MLRGNAAEAHYIGYIEADYADADDEGAYRPLNGEGWPSGKA